MSAASCATISKAQTAKTRLIFLGTGGGPRHFVPADDPTVTDQMWMDAARTHFKGEVIVGKDLLEI